MAVDASIHLLLTLWDADDSRRIEELDYCLERNLANPHIKKIHVFYECTQGLWWSRLDHEKLEVIPLRDYPAYKDFIDYANAHLNGCTVAIANSDIFFDESLGLLRGYDLSGKVLALTRYNLADYIADNGLPWERNSGAQDAWVFDSPLPSFFSDIRIGYFGCDRWIAFEMEAAGLRVLNPSMDIKTWHVHANRELVPDPYTASKSYLPALTCEKTKRRTRSKVVPIEPLGRWKLYTCFTESHQGLYLDWFLRTMKDDFEVIAERIALPYCAGFMKSGWVRTVIEKLRLILRAVDETPLNGFFIFSDVDIQWFGSIQEPLREVMARDWHCDLFFQEEALQRVGDSPEFCTGFFVCRANPRTRRFWELVQDRMIADGVGDQRAVKLTLQENRVEGLRVRHLPRKFWGSGTGTLRPRVWEPGGFLDPPGDALMHHANWTVGVANKVRQLQYVSRKRALEAFKRERGYREIADRRGKS